MKVFFAEDISLGSYRSAVTVELTEQVENLPDLTRGQRAVYARTSTQSRLVDICLMTQLAQINEGASVPSVPQFESQIREILSEARFSGKKKNVEFRRWGPSVPSIARVG